jgi:hypothetical protein
MKISSNPVGLVCFLSLAFFICMFQACKQEDKIVEVKPVGLTAAIEKIETAYQEGAIKIETPHAEGSDQKETIAPLSLQKQVRLRLLYHQKAFENRYLAARNLNANYPVGVIPAIDACPAGSEKIKFFMDNQDGGNSGKTGWTGAWTVDGNGNSWHTLCVVDGAKFKFITMNVSTQYLVVRLGNFKTAYMEPRVWNVHMDNEDDNNKNVISEGDFNPNVQNQYGTTLQFWAIAGKDTPGASQDLVFPDFGFSYGVFGTFTSPVVGGASGVGSLKTDDENKNNANQLFSVDWNTNLATNATSVTGLGVDRTNDAANTTFNIRRAR